MQENSAGDLGLVSDCKGGLGKVPGFPTWEIKGELFPGEKSIEELAKISGFKLE